MGAWRSPKPRGLKSWKRRTASSSNCWRKRNWKPRVEDCPVKKVLTRPLQREAVAAMQTVGVSQRKACSLAGIWRQLALALADPAGGVVASGTGSHQAQASRSGCTPRKVYISDPASFKMSKSQLQLWILGLAAYPQTSRQSTKKERLRIRGTISKTISIT